MNKCSELLWYKKEASDWNEALPIGNGRLGGMVYGKALNEEIQLNEDSVWSGGPRKRNNKQALENLDKVRRLLFDEKISEAEKIVYESFCGTPVNERHYQPLGSLFISLDSHGEEISDYTRSLDISSAVCQTRFKMGEANIVRTVIASNPHNVILINIKSDKLQSLDLCLCIDGRDDYFDTNSPVSQDTIIYSGAEGGKDGIHFASCIKVMSDGKNYASGNNLRADGCSEITIAVSCRTSFYISGGKEQDVSISDCEKLCGVPFEKLLEKHIEDYRSFYSRCSVSLCDNSEGASGLPTDERLEKSEKLSDNKLIEMYFNFGRYLMISASRQGTLPMNLQGIWNKDMWPAWGCRFTININTEMNYWCAENCGLGEMHMPLFDLIERMRPNGRETARIMYNCGGFVCHHNTDIWGDTAPQDLWIPGTQWPMGAAWLCLHIWEHYLFTLDKDFLSDKLETLEEACEFFADFLIEDKKGRLVTCPSVSPENTYLTESGTKGSVCIGPSMDSQIIYSLFTAAIEASKILQRESDFTKKLEELRERLPKPEIGKYGQIKEWAEDYDEVEIGHRHISQLFALYPSDQISVRKTPELSRGARATIERRLSHGGGHTGWSRAWIINMWARLMDGEKVFENIQALLSHSTNKNMFDNHPPFQIDGNFGGTAGIAESLLQSENDEIILLPALPEKWSSGEFRNLRARGGFGVSCKWDNGKIITAELTAEKTRSCTIVGENIKIYCNGGETETEKVGGAVRFIAEAGRMYNISL